MVFGENPLKLVSKIRLSDIVDTYNIYEIYYDRRRAVKNSEIYGDKQVHVTAMNTNRFPADVKKRHPPFAKEKGTVATWVYLPNTSIEITLTIFKQAGYKLLEILDRRDRMGHPNQVYIVAKKK